MATEHSEHELHEYPGGVVESPGGKIPIFLKLTYVGFTLFAILYFILYFNGNGSPLVELYNELTGAGS